MGTRAFRKLKNTDDPVKLFEELLNCKHGLDQVELGRLKQILTNSSVLYCDSHGMNYAVRSLLTAIAVCDEVGLSGSSVSAVLVLYPVQEGDYSIDEVSREFGEDTARLVGLLLKVSELYDKNLVVNSDNFSPFLLSFAEDVRVILILIAQRLTQLRLAGTFLTEDEQFKLSAEASFLYGPLAHRLGLYNIMSEMDDLALKYTDRETFNYIKNKLSETKVKRDAYIAKFIEPIKKQLEEVGLTFEIKGRTKSISSIRNKLKKQNIEFEAIYDLFAIRIVIDAPAEEERSQCWRAYSVITDMYQPNPKRLKDWISVPKSNGYESLHITVMGPDNRWVEVQIRTQRMDEIAERGLAAHWKYKGVKSEAALDDFMTSVRTALEQHHDQKEDVIKDFKLNLYDEEIYVFTPKGDLIKLPKGASVLDFAFAIHSKVGAKTVSAIVDGKNVSIRHILQNGDTVTVNTSNSQSPKRDWLKFVVTSKARAKIKQDLRAESDRVVELAKEELQRRLRNRKLELDDALLTKLYKKRGYKAATSFYEAIGNEKIDLNAFLDEYKQELDQKDSECMVKHSAESFVTTTEHQELAQEEDVLIIDEKMTGIDFQRAKCCNPIYGDKVFAFASQNGLKLHRMDCPNAPDLFMRFGYRVLKAEWKGSDESGHEITIKAIGNDDLSVVQQIIRHIKDEKGLALRSYNIESHDGLFQGYFYLNIRDAKGLNKLLNTMRGIKGVKSINRL
ncbi:TGS domain-containing protein [Porphyromonadaceae bacterium W3.11]|nr:TGS domain-containing protein [Porphyromonadaceae bacterium W3.11]